MYSFKDTIPEASDVALHPSEALKINGQYIEDQISGYRTLSVSGRESLSPEIETYSTGVSDGSKRKSKRYPERIITVKYRLLADTPQAFRNAYTKLAYILDVEDAELIFNDETDKFFIGTPCAIGEVEPGRNAVIGEFNIICIDPFKYSINEYEVQADTVTMTADDGSTYRGKAFNVVYNGTYKAFPKLIGEFYSEFEDGENASTLTNAGDCGFLAFFNNDNRIIQLGDPEELDGTTASKSQTLINNAFPYTSSWGTSAREAWKVNSAMTMPFNEAQVGTIGEVPSMPNAVDGNYFLSADNYGISSSGRYGASITRNIPADALGVAGASDFSLSFRHKHCPSNKESGKDECGIFYALLVSGSGSNRKIVAGVRIAKYSSGGWYGKIEFIVNDRIVGEKKFELSPNNLYFGVGGKQSSVISKNGNTVSFDIGGMKYSYTSYESSFATVQAKQVTFMFARYKSAPPLKYNGVTTVKFVKNNCSTYKDIPNKFGADDVVEVDCRNGEIYFNGLLKPDLGALGNDWEHFYLTPGTNYIGVSYSTWTPAEYAPTLKMRYREVFL